MEINLSPVLSESLICEIGSDITESETSEPGWITTELNTLLGKICVKFGLYNLWLFWLYTMPMLCLGENSDCLVGSEIVLFIGVSSIESKLEVSVIKTGDISLIGESSPLRLETVYFLLCRLRTFRFRLRRF